MSVKETAKRYVLFVISLFVNAFGVSVTLKGALGVSPLSCVGNVMSINFPQVSFGMWIFFWNLLLIALQVVVLGKKFKPIQLLQIPLSFILGYFNDLTALIITDITVSTYVMRVLMVFIGTIIQGVGISLAVIADVVLNSGEAFVKAVSDVTKKEFSLFKIIFDFTYVILAVIISLVLSGTVEGVREGTLISAVFAGVAVKIVTPPLKKLLTPILTDKVKS